MRRTSRFLAVGMVTVVAVAAPAALASADDHDNGNHAATWSHHTEEGGFCDPYPDCTGDIEDGATWGKVVSEWRQDVSGFGVSGSVHFVKDNGPKEK